MALHRKNLGLKWVMSGIAVTLVLAFSPAALAQGAADQASRQGETSEEAFAERLRAAYDLMQQAGSFDAGYARLRETLADAARTDRHVFTVKSYTEAGAIMYQNQIIDKAEEIFAEGAKTRAMQEDVKERADFYLNYALVKKAQNDYRGMVSMFVSSTHLFDQYYGGESSELMYANDLLATSIAAFGNIASGMNITLGNLEIAEKTLGPDDRFTWKLQNNLADMLREIGAPSRALQYDLNVLARRTAYYGPNHFNVLVSANNTAQDYLDLGNYGEALRYFQQNRDIAVALKQEGNLVEQAGAWLLYTRVLDGAQPLDDQTIARLEPLITDADYPEILGIKIAYLLAGHFAEAGDAERSMKHLDQAYRIAGSTFSLQHPLTFGARLAMASARARLDATAAAADFAALDQDMIVWNNMQVSTAGGRVVAEASRALADDMLYAYARFADQYPAAVPAFADAVRRWPTLEDGKRDGLRKLARLVDPNDTATRRLIRNGMRLSLAYQEVASGNDEGEHRWNTLIDQIHANDEKLNAVLADKYGFDQSVLDKPLPPAKDLLRANEALVQYFITRKWRADRESADPLDDTRLYAIVTRRAEEPRLYDLGDPRRIVSEGRSPQMASLRAARSSGERGAVPLTDRGAGLSSLYDDLLEPLEPSLGGVDTLFMVPDGKLFAVPFSLLRDRMGAMLEDRFVVRILTRPEALFNVSADQSFARGGKAVLAGGLDYGNGAEKGAEPLPGTRKEVDAIAAILRQDGYSAEVLTGDAAREKTLRAEMETATIAHLATHGAYREEDEGGVDAVNALWLSEVILSRSGDRRSMTRDDGDGRLYGMEILDWDLSSLDLLVLSACETARGEETFIGGLRGLPTAINIAGAKRSLVALWPVDDAGAAEFMVRFYEHLGEGRSYPEAVRRTRRDAREGKLPSAENPRVWAAFVMFEN